METISYTNTPFDEYLKETGRIEEELMVDDENYHDAESDSLEEVLELRIIEDSLSIPSTTTSTLPSSTTANGTTQHQQQSQPPLISLPNIIKNNKKDQFSDRLGYSLVTSSLLTPSLNDALILYPTPTRKITPISSPKSTPITTSIIQQPLEWGKNWESRGQIFTVISFYNFILSVYLFLQSGGGSSQKFQRSSQQIAGTPIDRSKPVSTHDLVLETIDNLVSIAQEVDLKIARALVGIREVENVGIDHPSLEQQDLSVSQNRRRPSSITMAPPSLRSFPLREHLSSTITTINNTITTSLSSIRPTPTSLLVTPITSPNPINAQLSSPIHFDSTTPTPITDADPDLPTPTPSKRRSTTWDEAQSFGGIDRSALSSPTRRPPPPPSPITIWENSPDSPTTDNTNAAGLPQKRRRPSSLHIWSVPPTSNSNGSSTAPPSSYSSSNTPNPAGGTLGRSGSLKRYTSSKPSEENLTTLFRSNSLRERTSISSKSNNTPRRLSSSFDTNTAALIAGSYHPHSSVTPIDTSPTSSESLQNSFESMHSNRLILLWRLITLTDGSTTLPVEDQEWLSIRATLENLVSVLKEVSGSITKAVDTQFGKDNIGSETFLLNNGRSSRLSMLSESDNTLPSIITTPITGLFPSLSVPTPNHSRPNSNPSSPTPPPAQSFAPSNPHTTLGPQAALNTFEQQTLQMSHTLRSLATKLSVVTEEISRRRSSSSSNTSGSLVEFNNDYGNSGQYNGEEVEDEQEELLVLHDSLKGELMRLSREWEESRITLREFIRKPSTTSSTSTSSSIQSKRSSYRPLSLSTRSPLLPQQIEEPESSPVVSTDLYDEGPLGELSNSTAEPFEELEARQALEDAMTSAYLPPSTFGREDLIYEAVTPASFTPYNSINGNTNGNITNMMRNTGMTREERIKSVKAERRKGSLLLTRSGSTSSIGMVEELKDVLELLKGRNKLGSSVGSNGNHD